MKKATKPDWWLETIHGKTALKERQFKRSMGNLNAPVKGPRGLRNIYQSAAVQRKSGSRKGIHRR